MSILHYYLDENDEPVGTADPVLWAREFKHEMKRVCVTNKDGVRVSTVFLGIDHNYSSGQPILFETMVFGGEHDNYTERYCTRQEAIMGHARICLRLVWPQPNNGSLVCLPLVDEKDGTPASKVSPASKQAT